MAKKQHNFYEDVLGCVRHEFGDDMAQFVPPLSDLDSTVEFDFFNSEATISAYLLKRIVDNVDRNFPSKGVSTKKLKSFIEEVGLGEVYTVSELGETIDDYFGYFFNEKNFFGKRKSPVSAYLAIAAYAHRFCLYSINNVEEKTKYILSKMRCIMIGIEEGKLRERLVTDVEKAFKKYIKDKRCGNLRKAMERMGGETNCSYIFPAVKDIFGIFALVSLQNGSLPECIFKEMLFHIGDVINKKKEMLMSSMPLIMAKRSAEAEEELSEVEADDEGESEKVSEKERKKATKKRETELKKKGKFHLLGRKELDKFFNEKVIDVVSNSKIYEKFGIFFPEPFLLEGPPGCGKTFAVERLAEYLNWETYHITSSSVGSTLIHETAKKTEHIFKMAAKQSPSMVVVDEMDAFMPDRSNTRHSDSHIIEEVSSFLKCIQEASKNKILVVGMTNYIKNIDPAILRSGRMGTHITLDMPSEEEITEVLKSELEKRPCDDFELKKYVEKLHNKPLSDVVGLVREASMHAAQRRAETISVDDMDCGLEIICKDDKEEKFIGFAT